MQESSYKNSEDFDFHPKENKERNGKKMQVKIITVAMLVCALAVSAFAGQETSNRIARRSPSGGGDVDPINDPKIKNQLNIAKILIKDELENQRKQNAFYSDGPSLYGFSRGLMTIVTSPGNFIWYPCKIYKETGNVGVIVASPIVAIGGVFDFVGDVLGGTVDMLSLGCLGDSDYLKSGERTWIYEWLSDPALIDGNRAKTETEALLGGKK